MQHWTLEEPGLKIDSDQVSSSPDDSEEAGREAHQYPAVDFPPLALQEEVLTHSPGTLLTVHVCDAPSAACAVERARTIAVSVKRISIWIGQVDVSKVRSGSVQWRDGRSERALDRWDGSCGREELE